MKLPTSVFEKTNPGRITQEELVKFSAEQSGLHLIEVTARTHGEKQLGGTNDEDLTLKLDGRDFSHPGKTPGRLIDSPTSFSGGRLHGLAKTVYILAFLEKKEHTLTLTPQLGADILNIRGYLLENTADLELELNIQAEDGDRREWITFVLDNLPLQQIEVAITYSRRKRDSDDVKILIDGQIQGNLLQDIKHFLWYFVGSLIPSTSPTKTETQVFAANLSPGLHYIELDADRMPTLDKITFNFGHKLSMPKRLPTVNDPEWTGNFDDDTEEMLLARLILGEAERQPKEAKIGVGFTVLNRLRKQNPNWGYSLREIILKAEQYDGMWNENTYKKVRKPFSDTSERRRREWIESYETAVGVLAGNLSDTASGATNFHSYEDPKDFPVWAIKETFKIKLGDIYFYELEK